MVPKGTVPFGTVLVCAGEPHAQESVGKAVDFCSALVIVGE